MKSVYDKNIIICDIDGTIANVQHRLHFIKNPDGTMKPYAERDWDSFNAACVDDTPYEDVIDVLHSLVVGQRVVPHRGVERIACQEIERKVHFFSGRNESVRTQTVQWLEKHLPITADWSYDDEVRNDPNYNPDFPISATWYEHLHMRSEGDRRPDTIVKLEMLQAQLFCKEEVLCILDDRQSVVDMWRENGFRVMQVDAWGEEGRGQDELRDREWTTKYVDCTADGQWTVAIEPDTEEHDYEDHLEEQAEQAFFEELDELRDSGEINMLGAPRWLVENYRLEKSEAKRIFMAWQRKRKKKDKTDTH